ncbi:DUF998 domain-containing protein [Spongiactinospora rosea]|nr:DUF998 domain-containing protein [Spongiactinospora rosea]
MPARAWFVTLAPTRLLLAAGVVAGIGMPAAIVADGVTRPGYSLWHHGASQLGTGPRWWLLTTTFVLGGLLLIAFAAGLRRVLHPGADGRWVPILLAVCGLSFIAAGVIPTDPALGYPPGQVSVVTVAGRVHGLIGLVLFACLSASAFVLARRLRLRSRTWGRFSRACGLLVIVLAVVAGSVYRLEVAGVLRQAPAGLLEHGALLVAFCWITVVGLRLNRVVDSARHPS